MLFHDLIISALFSGAVAVTTGHFSDLNVSIVLSNVDCNGSESSLQDCPHSTGSQAACGAAEDAGAVCQGMHCTRELHMILKEYDYHINIPVYRVNP